MKKTKKILLGILPICFLLVSCDSCNRQSIPTDSPASVASSQDPQTEERKPSVYMVYKTMAEENQDLPVGVEVSLDSTPRGGVFSVAFFTDNKGVFVSKAEATKVVIHECDENGESIFETFAIIG